MIRNIFRSIKKTARNIFYKVKQQEEAKAYQHKPAKPQLVTTKDPPRYGRVKMNQTNHKRYRHTDPKEVA